MISLPTFKGDFTDWSSFWRRFQDYVGNLKVRIFKHIQLGMAIVLKKSASVYKGNMTAQGGYH